MPPRKQNRIPLVGILRTAGRHPSRSLRVATSVSLAALVAGCSGSGSGVSGNDSAILGGFDATAARFDAIGDIAEVLNIAADGTLTMDAKCTGVLIGPHSVLTASHCTEKYETALGVGRDSFGYTEVYFRVGADSSKPQEQVRIVGYVKGPDVTGGFLGYGSDIAVFQLASDITDVTPLPVGAAPSAAEVGKPFIAIGYGLQSSQAAAGAFNVRTFGSMVLTALAGNPLQTVWPTFNAFIAAVQQIAPAVTAAQLNPFYNSTINGVLAGQQAFFSGVNDNGVEPCHGDSGGPILRPVGDSFEIAGIFSGIPSSVNGLCFGGGYYGLPNTADNTTFIKAELADATRGVANAGYCNATSAIRSVTAVEGTNPVVIQECLSLGMVCGVQSGSATCVSPVTTGPTTMCTLAGATFGVTGVSGSFPEVFNADGTSARGSTGFAGTYTFANGMLTMNEGGDACLGSPGTYAVTFVPDCSSFTIALADDPCELRAEAFDGATFARKP